MSARVADAFSDEWLEAREQRLRGVVGALFGAGATLNLVSEIAGIEWPVWRAIRVAVAVAFFAVLAQWLGAILLRRLRAGEDLSRRWTLVRRVRIAALIVAGATLAAALITGNFPLIVAMAAVVGGLAYELLTERRREERI